jgi:2'-hydroxyisoflavone reductase
VRVLVVGGSRFVGKHIVEAAVARGHEVTLFNRGNRPAPAGVARELRGDRDGDLSALQHGTWDAVVDTSAYVPRQVRSLVDALGGRVGYYALVSTISVYAEQTRPHLDEDAAVAKLDDEATEEVTDATYGGLKALCERVLAEGFEGPTLVVRPGLVVGPDDPTDRFTYWPARLARGGEVLVPARPEAPVQCVDARALGAFTVRAMEQGLTGTFNATSEAGRFTLGGLLEACLAHAPEGTRLVPLDESWLLEQGVVPFADLPLWLPGEYSNFFLVDSSRAHAAGLEDVPLDVTVRDTLAWWRSSGAPTLKTGLSAERENEVLRRWRAERGA